MGNNSAAAATSPVSCENNNSNTNAVIDAGGSGNNNPTSTMVNKLRANSYIDRKSSCEDTATRGMHDRNSHNKTAVFNNTIDLIGQQHHNQKQ